MKCYVLGPAGTNGHEVAERIWPNLNLAEQEIVFCNSNTAILDACLHDGVGVVPVENSSAGLVAEVVNQLLSMSVFDDPIEKPCLGVFRSVIMPIRHCLAVHQDFPIGAVGSAGAIKMVISHPQALAQCSKKLDRLGLGVRKPASSTADAARQIAVSQPSEGLACICSNFAAQKYSLQIAKTDFQDSNSNSTKFYLFGQRCILPVCHVASQFVDEDRALVGSVITNVIFRLPDRPSSLADALWCFGGGRGINLSTIHSIPTGQMGQIAFWLEFEEHRSSEKGQAALDLLEKVAFNVNVFGSFYLDILS